VRVDVNDPEWRLELSLPQPAAPHAKSLLVLDKLSTGDAGVFAEMAAFLQEPADFIFLCAVFELANAWAAVLLGAVVKDRPQKEVQVEIENNVHKAKPRAQIQLGALACPAITTIISS
jgi:hypothetical protein